MQILQAYEHEGMTLEVIAYETDPPRRMRVPLSRAPGARKFAIDRLDAMLEGEEVIISGRVSGRNVAYIYAELLLKDPESERYYGPVVREHVVSAVSKETRGIARPRWEESVEVTVRLTPSVRVLSDGVDSAFCFPAPEGYGRPGSRLDGLYTPAGGAAPFRARLIFDEAGEIREIVAHKEQARRSFPRVMTPTVGDRFSPFVQMLTLPAGGEEWETATALSNPLTFGEASLRMVPYAPLPGDYLAGLLVEDLDGGLTRKYAPLAIAGPDDPGA